jgi:methylmalonyl-CoA mutase
MTASETELPLAADFEPATKQAWRSLVSAVLARSATRSGPDAATSDPEEALGSTTYDGIPIRPLYTRQDLPDGWDAAVPGQAPFRRGSTVDGAAAAGWDVRQRHADADPKRLNTSLLTDLENGVTSLWLVLGGGGLAVEDLAVALDGVYLDLAPVAIQAGAATEAAVAALLALADARGVPRSELRASFGADPIGELARTGAEPDLGVVGRLADLARDRAQVTVAVADGTVYHDAGGSDADEIAIATAVGVAYLRALVDSGWSTEQALGLIEFRLAVTADQFSSIAKLRAARIVWARVAELSGVPEPERGQRQHAVTSAAMLTRRDPWVNMLRTTIACFAAAVGGTDAITVLPFDSAIGVSDDFARRIARNTQSVLHDESSLARVIDPAGGSFYVEALTDELAERAWQIFTGIERAGGALGALRSGHIPSLLADTREQRRKAVATRKDPITGVSEFAFIDEPPVSRPAPQRPSSNGLLPVIHYAQDFERLRDRSDAHVERTGARPAVFLAGLGTPALSSARAGFAANLFQAAGIRCVSATGEVAELVEQFTASRTSVACLCSTDAVYAEQAALAARALRVAGARTVYLAGRPGERAESDRAAGIDAYLFAGIDAIEFLTATLDDLGVNP